MGRPEEVGWTLDQDLMVDVVELGERVAKSVGRIGELIVCGRGGSTLFSPAQGPNYTQLTLSAANAGVCTPMQVNPVPVAGPARTV